LAESKEFRGIG